MAFWVPAHQELGQHPKTRRFARALGVSLPTAVGHLMYVWWWAITYAPSGDLSKYDDADLADGALWEGDPAAFAQALAGAGWVDADRRLHDWQEYGGKVEERKQRNAERMRRERASHVRRTSPHVRRQEEEKELDSDTERELDVPTQGSIPGGEKPSARAPARGSPRPTSAGMGTEGEKPVRAAPEPGPRARAAPKPNKVAEVIDAIRALGVEAVVTPADAAAVKACALPPGVIAEAYAAGAKGEWAPEWLQASLSLQLVCRKIAGYLAQRDHPRARSPTNGRAGGLSPAELMAMSRESGGGP